MLSTFNKLKTDWSLSASVAGFLAVLISYAGPLIIFFQAATVAHVSHEMMISWIWAISIGAALSGIYLSWKYKTPVITAWSAPGTALLVTLFPHITLNQAVAAYITSAVVILVVGVSGYFDKLISLIPKGLAAGMMAGILFQFGLGLFKATNTMPVLVLGMVAAYILAKRVMHRYAVVWVLVAGILLALVLGQFHPATFSFKLAVPIFIAPEWTWACTFNLALPLVLVSLSGQYLPGMAILKLNGYHTPAKPILTATSIASIFFSLFGGINIVLASITAALCTGKDSHDHPERRYIAGIANGLFYILGGLFAGSIVTLFTLFPKELVAALAGLALLGAIGGNITAALHDEKQRDPALLTFLATASGMTFLGLGAVFWGIVIGSVAHVVLQDQPMWQFWRKASLADAKSS